jgi:hypothetical protein
MLAIERFDVEIKAMYKPHKNRYIFDSFPGAGPQIAPRLLAEMGSNRDRYHSCEEIQKYAGIAPVTELSGKKNGYIGDTHAPRSYGKHSLSGQVNPCAIPFGQKPIIGSKKLKKNHTIPSSEHWHLSESGYCFGVGKQGLRMMNQRIYKH